MKRFYIVIDGVFRFYITTKCEAFKMFNDIQWIYPNSDIILLSYTKTRGYKRLEHYKGENNEL